jgi:hypothetical protein
LTALSISTRDLNRKEVILPKLKYTEVMDDDWRKIFENGKGIGLLCQVYDYINATNWSLSFLL